MLGCLQHLAAYFAAPKAYRSKPRGQLPSIAAQRSRSGLWPGLPGFPRLCLCSGLVLPHRCRLPPDQAPCHHLMESFSSSAPPKASRRNIAPPPPRGPSGGLEGLLWARGGGGAQQRHRTGDGGRPGLPPKGSFLQCWFCSFLLPLQVSVPRPPVGVPANSQCPLTCSPTATFCVLLSHRLVFGLLFRKPGCPWSLLRW